MSTDLSPRARLAAWANEQDSWVRELVGPVMNQGRLRDQDIAAAYRLMLAEKGPNADSNLKPTPLLEDTQAETEAEAPLRLLSLSKISGVNALAANQKIKFHKALTVLFGENGSGKTGYVRVIKRAAGRHTRAEILGNVHKSDGPVDVSALFEVSVGSTIKKLQWENEEGLPPLTRVNVFDSSVARLHTDGKLNYVFTPAGLTLFEDVTDALQRVQERLEREVTALKSIAKPDLSAFSRGSTPYALVESLRDETDVIKFEELAAELRVLAELKESVEDDFQQLQAEIADLSTLGLDERVRAVHRQLSDVDQLLKTLDALVEFNPDLFNRALEEVAEAEQEVVALRTRLFGVTDVSGELGHEWESFIEAGQAYANMLDDDYPTEHADCIYCGQPLAADAVDLIKQYATFLEGKAKGDLQEARARVADHQLSIRREEVEQSISHLQTLPGTASSWIGDAQELFASGLIELEKVSLNHECSTPGLRTAAERVRTQVHELRDQLTSNLKALEAQQTNRSEELARRRSEAAELADRIELARRLDGLMEYAKEAKRAAHLESLGQEISNRVLHSLTRASMIASEDLVNRNFEQLFNEECDALNCPRVNLSFQGRSGHAERQKNVSGHQPSAVLSEGEQKVLALADFLAECQMSGTTSPIVFDDPITSLDYRYVESVADRIRGLTKSHQVVVFTHNVMFAWALLDRQHVKSQLGTYIEVRAHGGVKGVVLPDADPRFDTPRTIKNRINKAIDDVKRAKLVDRDRLIAHAYDLLRSWCEVFAEQELLANVTRRHQPNIIVPLLRDINVDRLKKAADALSTKVKKFHGYVSAHSSSHEQSNVVPTFAELERDWQDLKQIQQDYGASE